MWKHQPISNLYTQDKNSDKYRNYYVILSNMSNDTYYGKICTIMSVFGATISFTDFYEVIKLVGAVIAIVSGGMAIRYYHHATKKIKQS